MVSASIYRDPFRDRIRQVGHELNMVIPILIAILLTITSDVFPAEKHECSYCHLTSDKMQLKAPLAELCLECHSDRKSPNEHKVDILPSMKVVDLPLGKEGTMTCITCHDPHGKSGHPMLLRANPSEICSKCHLK